MLRGASYGLRASRAVCFACGRAGRVGISLYRVYAFCFQRIKAGQSPERLQRGMPASVGTLTLDVFDTALLRRTARPDDVFALAAHRVLTTGRTLRTCSELVAARLKADRRARECARATGLDEITFDEIWKQFPSDWSEEELQAYHSEELQSERDTCVANPQILEFYRSMRDEYQIVFVSDTPHSPSFLAELLSQSGFTDPTVFTSSASRKTKVDGGSLFDVVLERLGLAPQAVLHIGDNLGSDVINAGRRGLHALWLRSSFQRPKDPPAATGDEAQLALSVLTGSARLVTPENASRESAVWYSLGAYAVAPMLLAFTGWLQSAAQQAAVERLVFLARDGRVLRAAYMALVDEASQLAHTYLHVSRRALAFPMFEQLGSVELSLLAQHYDPVSVRELLRRVDIHVDAVTDALTAADLTPDTVLCSTEDDARFRRALEQSSSVVIQAARREREALLGYLERENLFSLVKTGLVDIGWRGTMQRALTDALRLKEVYPPLVGFYFGTNADIAQVIPARGSAIGWLQDVGRQRFGREIVKAGWGVLELIFSSSEGSTQGYKISDGMYLPVLGAVPREQAYGLAADSIQRHALQVLAHYKAAFGKCRLAHQPDEQSIEQLSRVVLSPTVEEARAVGDLELVEGFGARWSFPIARKPTLKMWLRPDRLLSLYRRSLWRRGLARRLLPLTWLHTLLVSSIDRAKISAGL